MELCRANLCLCMCFQICEYYGTRCVPRSLWVNNRTSPWWEVVPTCSGSTISECPRALFNSSVFAWKQRWGEASEQHGNCKLTIKLIFCTVHLVLSFIYQSTDTITIVQTHLSAKIKCQYQNSTHTVYLYINEYIIMLNVC